MVGLLTFHRGPNYGGYLQAWHLREAARSLGYKCEIINYQNPVHEEYERLHFRGIHPREFLRYARLHKKRAGFTDLVAQWGNGEATNDPAAVDWSSYDKVVVGSDIVWDYMNPRLGRDPVYFGSHPRQFATKIHSYAASCGESAGVADPPSWVKEGLARFRSLGVRDTAAYELAERFGTVKPELVVDPTWLQDDPVTEWNGLPARPYVLVYGAALNRPRAQAIRRYCRSHGLALIGAASGWGMVDRIYNGITPWQWVELYRNATAVVTATLHGMLYAIKFSKPFLMVRLGPASAKSQTVIERSGCAHRVIDPEIEISAALLDRALGDNSDHRGNVADWVVCSRSFLEESLRS